MFRRYLAIALLFVCASCGTRDPDFGSGPITLSPQVKASFEDYKGRDAPAYFVVTESGLGSYYVYCVGGFNCTYPAARMQALGQCRRHHPGEECKIYAVRRSVVWRDADRASQLSANDRLIRDCLDGGTPEGRIDKCSQVIASQKLAQSQKRGAFYVRARAYEQIGRISEAEQDYRDVLGIDPNHAAAKARLEHLIAPAAPPRSTPPKST